MVSGLCVVVSVVVDMCLDVGVGAGGVLWLEGGGARRVGDRGKGGALWLVRYGVGGLGWPRRVESQRGLGGHNLWREGPRAQRGAWRLKF